MSSRSIFRTEIVIGILVAFMSGCGYFYVIHIQNQIAVLEHTQIIQEGINAEIEIDQMNIDAIATRLHQIEIDAKIRTKHVPNKSKINNETESLERKINSETAATFKKFKELSK